MFKKLKTIRKARENMKKASSYLEWLLAATTIDTIEGTSRWIKDEYSPFYDVGELKNAIAKLKELQQPDKAGELIKFLEQALYRHHHDVVNPQLYSHTRSGESKILPRNFLQEATNSLNFLCDTPLPGISTEFKLKKLKKYYKTFGRSALMLSGGATMGIYHLGVVKALFETNLLPKIITGSSMGAIVAAGLCTRTRREARQFFNNPENIQRRGLNYKGFFQILKEKSLFNQKKLLTHILANIGGDYTFKEAWEKSGYNLNISVSPTRTRQKPKILNHLSTPDLLISQATLASCAMPFLFKPIQLKYRSKDGQIKPYLPSERWVDGTLGGDLPMARVSRLHNANHFIVSQTNPHIYPFFPRSESPGLMYLGVDLAGSLLRNQARSLIEILRKYPRRKRTRSTYLDQLHSLTSQPYSGDINIHPHIEPAMITRLVSNPTRKEIDKYIHEGERYAWPKIAIIRDQTLIARTFESCIEQLENQVNNSNMVES
ncbi:MAG: DUF3336 domain-containing protein [Deltaproteobacteria bacterium]|jgi:TAG lipase/steryl ester hydrolase/phospholipase A2/LPA acyltransferase|nr:DUF3336 domain-containing protein [Deltaproteobacteria bacterium]